MFKSVLIAGVVCGAVGTAQAAVTVSVGSSAPTYAQTLNFDEVGGPTGSVASNAFAGIGIASGVSGAGELNIGPSGFPFVGTGNSANGSFGIYLTFAQPLISFSSQYWDNSGRASFFGGGCAVNVLNNGEVVGSYFYDSPAFSANATNSWVNITTSNGSVFNEVQFVGFGFTPQAYVDNLSWTVPQPAGLALLGVAGLVGRRRR